MSEKTIMYLRGIRQDVARSAKAAAAREGLTLAAYVERALENALKPGREPDERLDALDEDMRWYEANKASILKRHEGEYLAIVGKKVVDHDTDLDAIGRRVFDRYGSRPVFMPHCVAEEREVRIYSPRVVR